MDGVKNVKFPFENRNLWVQKIERNRVDKINVSKVMLSPETKIEILIIWK